MRGINGNIRMPQHYICNYFICFPCFIEVGKPKKTFLHDNKRQHFLRCTKTKGNKMPARTYLFGTGGYQTN